jgi:hypothetical protein
MERGSTCKSATLSHAFSFVLYSSRRPHSSAELGQRAKEGLNKIPRTSKAISAFPSANVSFAASRCSGVVIMPKVPVTTSKSKPMFLTPFANGTCEAREFYEDKHTGTPGMTGIFHADPVSPKADSDIDKKRSTPGFLAPSVGALAELDCSTPHFSHFPV